MLSITSGVNWLSCSFFMNHVSMPRSFSTRRMCPYLFVKIINTLKMLTVCEMSSQSVIIFFNLDYDVFLWHMLFMLLILTFFPLLSSFKSPFPLRMETDSLIFFFKNMVYLLHLNIRYNLEFIVSSEIEIWLCFS